MQEQRDQLSGDYEQKMKTLKKEHEDQIHDLNHAHKVEKHDLIEKLRAEISQVCWYECTSVDLLIIEVHYCTGDGRGSGVKVRRRTSKDAPSDV